MLNVTTIIEVRTPMSVVALRLIFGIVTIGELFEFIVASNPVAIFAIEKAWAVHPMVPIVSVGHNMGLRSVFFVTVLVTASALVFGITTFSLFFSFGPFSPESLHPVGPVTLLTSHLHFYVVFFRGFPTHVIMTVSVTVSVVMTVPMTVSMSVVVTISMTMSMIVAIMTVTVVVTTAAIMMMMLVFLMFFIVFFMFFGSWGVRIPTLPVFALSVISTTSVVMSVTVTMRMVIGVVVVMRAAVHVIVVITEDC